MAVTKKIEIDGKQVEFKASAAIPRIYRNKFGRDVYKDLMALNDAIKDQDEEASSLDGFSLVICKPDRSVIYYDCQWQELTESAEVGGMVLEQVRIVAGRRTELLRE